MPGGRAGVELGRPDGGQVAFAVFRDREVALHHILHGLGAPGGHQVGVDQLVAVGSAVLDGHQHPRAPGVLVEQLVDPVGIVLEDDKDRLAQVDGAHQIQRKGDGAGDVGVDLVRHKVVQDPVPADVIGRVVGDDRDLAVADVNVEGQVGDLAGIVLPDILDLVGEGQVGGVGAVHGGGLAPRLGAGEGLVGGDLLVLVPGAGGRG